ncbi:MAG TPA: xanthine dehydrogenase family protein subunit M [Stellaceae bacterium]|nr:xanthine dehydrogenase family protein subunit M [Stellaceae bacterium]
MKPPRFRYHDPTSVAEVTGLLASLDNARVLAGGQSLMPMLNFRYVLPDHLIDINGIAELSYVRWGGAALDLGAMTRQRELEFSDDVKARCPILYEAILQVGHRQTRNRGTVGGSLCHLDPAAEIVSVAAALDATVHVVSAKGRRDIAMAEFSRGYMTPALESDEMVTGVSLPLWPEGHGFAFIEFSRRHGDFAICSAAALLEEDRAGKITRASVTIGGVGPAPVRAREVERAITGQAASEALFRDACESCRKIEAMSDVHAPADYRQHLAAVLSRRALEKAHQRVRKAA